MPCTHHHVHTEQRRDYKHVELAFLETRIGTAKPLARLYKHDERACGKDCLHYIHRSRGNIHAAEGRCRLLGPHADKHLHEHQQAYKRIEPLTLAVARRCEIGDEDDNEDSHQRGFRYHV